MLTRRTIWRLSFSAFAAFTNIDGSLIIVMMVIEGICVVVADYQRSSVKASFSLRGRLYIYLLVDITKLVLEVLRVRSLCDASLLAPFS